MELAGLSCAQAIQSAYKKGNYFIELAETFFIDGKFK
jgi:hypothetical protein